MGSRRSHRRWCADIEQRVDPPQRVGPQVIWFRTSALPFETTASAHASFFTLFVQPAPNVLLGQDAAMPVNSGMRFPPGQQDALLTHVRPVLTEIERRVGATRDRIDRTSPSPGKDYVSGPKAVAVLAWTIDAHAQRGREGRSVIVSFEPFDGRLTSLTISAP